MHSRDGDERNEGIRQDEEVVMVNSLSDLEDKSFAECFSVIKREWFSPLEEHGCKFDLHFLAQTVFFFIRYKFFYHRRKLKNCFAALQILPLTSYSLIGTSIHHHICWKSNSKIVLQFGILQWQMDLMTTEHAFLYTAI